ncbi:MAG: hypothetical protein WA058_01890 [Minisyncoccia bacterium]
MSENNDVASVPEAQPHKQFMQEVLPISNWGEWLELAKAAITLDQKLGLLHCAFGVELGQREYDPDMHKYPPYTSTERLEFFFGVADGWLYGESFDFRTPEERFERQGYPINETRYFSGYDKNGDRREQGKSQLRQQLATKAFDLLCLNFFRMSEKREYRDTETPETKWLRKIVSGPLYPTIRKFFRVEKAEFGGVRIRNLSIRSDARSNNEKIAIDFLLKLPKFLWEWKESQIESYWPEKERVEMEAMNTLTRSRVNEAKPWILEILILLGETRLLRWDWILEFDEACLAKLKKIALRNELQPHIHLFDEFRDGPRKVATIDEACYIGSPAAWLIKKHELMTRERTRLSDIQKAKRGIQEAKQKIKKLKTT